MTEQPILITEFDRKRLLALLEGLDVEERDRGHIADLAIEIERAELVPPDAVPADLVTMNSRIRIRDLDSEEVRTITVVFPGMANYEEGRISILAPLGTAVLGYRRGDEIEWEVPSGAKRILIEDVEYQPEAAGDRL